MDVTAESRYILNMRKQEKPVAAAFRLNLYQESCMVTTLRLRGKLVSGAGKAAFFTQLDWVKDQCLDKLKLILFPGTLNIAILQEDIPILLRIGEAEGIRLIPPDAAFCEGRVLPATIENVKGCIVIPPQDVTIHAPNIVEFMAPVMVKAALGLEDGDMVTVSVDL